MMVLVTYDVETVTAAGKKRLRKVAKHCEDYGQRVQNSVFECLLEPAEFVKLRTLLEKIIEPETDSLRFYQLGANWQNRVEHIGTKTTYNPEGVIII
jgi:CRISPR-associated protein Cas2